MYPRQYVIDLHVEEKQADFRMQHKFTSTPCRHVSQNTGKEEGAKQEQTVAVAFQLPFLPVAVQLEQLTIVGGAVQTCNLTERLDPRFTLFTEWTLLSELKSLKSSSNVCMYYCFEF